MRNVDLIKADGSRHPRAPAPMPKSAAFGGLFRSQGRGALPIRCWSPATDGVGTKLKIAIETGLHGGIGNRPGGDVGQ